MMMGKHILRHSLKRLPRLVFLLVFCLTPFGPAARAAESVQSAEEAALNGPHQPETLSAGAYHSCALQSDGTLRCWGRDDFGQATPPGGQFSQVSAGELHTCGLQSDGTLACWGSDAEGQALPPTGTFLQVSAGGAHTCAIRSNGTLACWGDDSYNQATPPPGTFLQVSAGKAHTCALASNGTLTCWGDDYFGQATPQPGMFLQVSAGAYHTCGVHSNGTLSCWGRNNYNQATPPTRTFTQVSAGELHTCALQSDGALSCWGRNNYNQATPPTGTFTQVNAGAYHTCGLYSDGTLDCWGLDTSGQASPPAGDFTLHRISAGGSHTCGVDGNGLLSCWGYDNYGQATPPPGAFAQVSAGEFHTCGLKEDGTLDCWGDEAFGQSTPPTGTFMQTSAGLYHSCGLESNGQVDCWGRDDFGQATPTDGPFAQISAGAYHTCGLRDDGTLDCWGDNFFGQSDVPTGTFTQVSAGFYHTCGLRSTGTLACWGRNSDGQTAAPTGEFIQVSSGYYHTCALRNDGQMACWGKNTYGQATARPGIFLQVSAGGSHTCAVQGDGALLCWGRNAEGQSPPVALTPLALPHGNEGLAYTQTLTASGGMAPYTFTLSMGDLPPGLALRADGLISGTATTGGVYTFTVMAEDSSFPLAGRQTYSLLISHAPSAITDTYTATEDTPLWVAAPGVLGNDEDIDGDILSATLTIAPLHGVVSMSLSGGFVYTPSLNYNGIDVFTYTATDGVLTDTALVSVTVFGTNDPPRVIAGKPFTTTEGTLASFLGRYIDPDLPGGQVASGLSRSPEKAAYQIAWDFGDDVTTSGILTPTHAYAEDGFYTVTLVVTDDMGAAGMGTTSVTVYNAAPVLSPMSDQSSVAGEVLTVTASYNDPGWLDTHSALIAWGDDITTTIELTAGLTSFDFSHAYLAAGTYTVTVILEDDDGGSDSLSFIVIVEPYTYKIWLPVLRK